MERGIRSSLGPAKAHRFMGRGQESRVVQPDLGLGWPEPPATPNVDVDRGGIAEPPGWGRWGLRLGWW